MNDTLRDAARRVVISADQGETGLTASDALEALRAALSDPATSTHKQPPLAPTPPDDEPVVGPIQHSNSMCQKDGCTCWCQACERHNWRHERTLAPPPASVRDDSMELAHIVHGASDMNWLEAKDVAERLWTAGVRVVEDER